MKLVETLRMIQINLLQNKSKVLLTSLGIIIGTLTIILVIAIGKGGEEQIAQQYSHMSAETIYVNPTYGPNMDFLTIPKLDSSHLSFILEENPYLKDIYLRATFYKDAYIGSKKEFLSFAAVTDGYCDISKLSILAGSDFSEEEMQSGRRTMVIGHNIASQKFGSPEEAIGESIRIGNYRYEIIGVLEKKSEGLQGLSPDDTIFLPFVTASENGLMDDYTVPQAVGLALNTDVVEKAMTRLKSSIDYLLEDSSGYLIEDAGGRIDAAMESARTMKMLLISVAAIVFLVGGIGIMNVLFVSVKERTREIGILKALGTSKKDILLLFLLESVGIGVLGGITGIVLSYFALPLMNYTDIAVSPSAGGQLLALIFAIFTAALFGFYPAYKASELKPIDALNYE